MPQGLLQPRHLDCTRVLQAHTHTHIRFSFSKSKSSVFRLLSYVFDMAVIQMLYTLGMGASITKMQVY